MAGANNKALKKAGMTPREVETFRATGGKSLRATVTAAKNSPTVQGANADFRAKAAAGLKSVAERKAALQAARQQRVGKSLGAAMQVARGIRALRAERAARKPSPSPAPGTALDRLKKAEARAPYAATVPHHVSMREKRVFGQTAAELRARVGTAQRSMEADWQRRLKAGRERDAQNVTKRIAAKKRADATRSEFDGYSVIGERHKVSDRTFVQRNAGRGGGWLRFSKKMTAEGHWVSRYNTRGEAVAGDFGEKPQKRTKKAA